MKTRRSKSLWRSSCFGILAAFMVLLLGQTVLAAGSVSLKADKTSVSVGDEITLTLKASGASGAEAPDITVKYDSQKLSFVSCNQNYGGGGGGLITLRDMSATIKLKASAQGSAQVSVEAILDGDGVDVPSASVGIEIGGAGGSGNGLKSMNVTEGTLSPAFSSAVKEYTMTVPASVTSVAVSAVPADDGAKVSAVTGFNDLAFGENEGVVTVTEKDGSQIDYHVIITRSESDEPIEEGVILDDLIPLADGSLSVSTTFPEDVLPKGFVKTEISYEERMVEAAKLEMGELYLLYMTDASGGNEFYVYDQDTGKISDFIQFFSIEDKFIVLLEPDDTVSAPDGFVKAELRYGGKVITGWAPAAELGTQEASTTRPSPAETVLGDIYAGVAKVLYVHAQEPEMLKEGEPAAEDAPAEPSEDGAAPDEAAQGEPAADAPAEEPAEAPAQTEPEGSEGVTADTGFVLVYAMNSEGQKGLYIYDKLEGTYQRYLMSGAGGSAGGGAGGLLSGGGDFESQAKQRFIIICILAVVIVVLLLVILNMFLRLREYKRNDEEVYEEDEEFLPPAGKDRLKAVKKEKVRSRRGRDEMDYLLDKADTADDDKTDDDDPEDDEEDDDSIVFGDSKPKRRSSQKRPTFDDIEIVVPEGLFSRRQKEDSGEMPTETKKESAKKQDKRESGKESKKAAKKAGRRGARQEDEWEWEAIVQEAEQAEELKSEKRPKAKQKAAPEPETAPEPKLKAVAKQEAVRRPKAESKPAPDPEPKPEPKPVPKPEPEPELDLDEDFEFEFIDLDD